MGVTNTQLLHKLAQLESNQTTLIKLLMSIDEKLSKFTDVQQEMFDNGSLGDIISTVMTGIQQMSLEGMDEDF